MSDENVVPDWTIPPAIRAGEAQSVLQLMCGAHGCGGEGFVRDEAEAKRVGWFHDTKDGYGWICPDCAP